ncbi:MAG: RstB, partial [Dehalococcoidia bacterium]|nr:RstB [Dehalococcoidia bacterium]
MSFRVTARTVLQLGAELISSDSVAFYELIKNAFDAGSKRVFIDVRVRMDHRAYLSHSTALRNGMPESPVDVEAYRRRILDDIDTSAPEADRLIRRIKRARTFQDLLRRLEEANYVQVRDRGHGMSAKDLEEIYLTIGTPHRRRQRARQSGNGSRQPILGEKGLGRLSAMRLGWRLEVLTTVKGEKRENRLHVDWRQFTDDNLMVEDVSVSPTKHYMDKTDPNRSGTRIRIYALTSPWSPTKLSEIATDEFSKLTDPFVPESRYPINVTYNDRPVRIRRFDNILFDFAHASAEAEYTIGEDGPRFVGTVHYR